MKYKLKEDFLGLKKDTILENDGTSNYLGSYYYKGAKFEMYTTLEIIEEVKDEPLFYTNEDEVYLDGKKVGVLKNTLVYYVTNTLFLNSWLAYYNGSEHNIKFKYFLTQRSAEDYIKLHQAIKDSGLKIGDIIDLVKLRITKWSSTTKDRWYEGFITNLQNEEILDFKFVLEKPCAILKHTIRSYAIPLEQFNKPKLLFGDKEVTLNLSNGETVVGNSIQHSKDVLIQCAGEVCLYSQAKKFRDAINTIELFRFGKYNMKSSINLTNFKIGCTKASLEQIDNILKACEEMLKS